MSACLYFDCFSGAAGDMLVGSLLDLGGSLDELQADLDRLGLDDLRVHAERAWQGGLAGTRFRVETPASAQPLRHLADILKLLHGSGLPAEVQQRAQAVFERIARAEAKVHGTTPDEVHFHEVGALDSIADVIGFCALHARLGSPPILCSPLAIGEGFVHTEHGKIPVPAMATLELLTGVPIEMSGLREELVTPTGAALLGTLGEEFGRHFSFTPQAVGYGLGTRERSDPPNAVRAVLGLRAQAGGDRVTVIETNLDDITGQELSRLLDLCLAAGALDVITLPAHMKKGRPGHLVQVLAGAGEVAALEALLLRESPALGVRRHAVERRILAREEATATSRFGPVRVKRHQDLDGHWHQLPEFDELQRLATEQGRPLAEIRELLRTDLRQAGNTEAN